MKNIIRLDEEDIKNIIGSHYDVPSICVKINVERSFVKATDKSVEFKDESVYYRMSIDVMKEEY